MRVFLKVDSSLDEQISVEVSHVLLPEIIRGLDNSPDAMRFLDHLAIHPSSLVREAISRRDDLSKELMNRLLSDEFIDIVRNICNSESFFNFAETSDVIKAAIRDMESARIIANYVSFLNSANRLEIYDHLIAHPDPSVRAALVDGINVPQHVVGKLCNDPDAYVREAASKKLD